MNAKTTRVNTGRVNRSRLYILSSLVLVVLVGLFLGAFSVLGSRTHIAGVDYLVEFGYQCESEFTEATYYQSECEYGIANPNVDSIENSEDESEDDSSEYSLGYYPWIWESTVELADTERPFLAQRGTRMNIVSWSDGYPEMEINFASGELDVAEGEWPIGDQQIWQYAGPFLNNSTSCEQLVDVDDSVSTALDAFILDNDSPSGRTVVVTVPLSLVDLSTEDGYYDTGTVYYCMELRYIPASTTEEQSLWLEFKLSLGALRQQTQNRRHARTISRVFDRQQARAIMTVYFGTGESASDDDCADVSTIFGTLECEEVEECVVESSADSENNPPSASSDPESEDNPPSTDSDPICQDDNQVECLEDDSDCRPTDDYDDEADEEEFDIRSAYVDIEALSIELPRNWDDLSVVEKMLLNPYGCSESDTTFIDAESGKCLAGAFELGGLDGTPIRLTIELPTDWSTAAAEEKEQRNPYGCYDFDQIRLSDGKCLSGEWSIWGYVITELEFTSSDSSSYNPAKDIKLYVQTFKNTEEKEAYFTANPEKHPCSLVLDGTLTYTIEADLYIIYAAAETLKESFQTHQMQTLFRELNLRDSQAVLRASIDCQDRSDTLTYQQLLCQQSNSTEGQCAAVGLNDTLLSAIEATGASCQLMYDNASASSDGIPTQADLADCLQLKDSIRQDFIDKTQIVDEDHELYAKYRRNLGVYLSETKLPYTIWEGDVEQNLFQPEQQRYRFEMIALHEYLHKAYFEDLSLEERMRVHQEILALYEDNEQLFFDYYGVSSLGKEVRFQIGRHGAANVFSIGSIIDEINIIAPQIRQALPADIQAEYSAFLNDRHGMVAFIYALAETQHNQWLNALDFKDENLLKLNFTKKLKTIIEETNQQRIADGELPLDIGFGVQLPRIVPSAGGDVDDLDVVEEYTSSLILERIYRDARGFFVEGYPIMALETTHPLSDWLQAHFEGSFDRTNLTHYFQYHPRLNWNIENPIEPGEDTN